jgi:hypothetical protein
MEFGHLKERVIGQFVIVLKEQESESLKPHRAKPALYLKCWGSDYPYLQGLEQQKRWLPVVADSATWHLIRD